MRKGEAIQVISLIFIIMTGIIGLMIIDYQNEMYKKYGSSTLMKKVTEADRKRLESMSREQKQKLYNELRNSQNK